MGSHPITFLWLWPATDNEPHCRHVHINKIWRRTESTPRSGRWRSRMAAIYSDCSIREMIIICDSWYICVQFPFRWRMHHCRRPSNGLSNDDVDRKTTACLPEIYHGASRSGQHVRHLLNRVPDLYPLRTVRTTIALLVVNGPCYLPILLPWRLLFIRDWASLFCWAWRIIPDVHRRSCQNLGQPCSKNRTARSSEAPSEPNSELMLWRFS